MHLSPGGGSTTGSQRVHFQGGCVTSCVALSAQDGSDVDAGCREGQLFWVPRAPCSMAAGFHERAPEDGGNLGCLSFLSSGVTVYDLAEVVRSPPRFKGEECRLGPLKGGCQSHIGGRAVGMGDSITATCGKYKWLHFDLIILNAHLNNLMLASLSSKISIRNLGYSS